LSAGFDDPRELNVKGILQMANTPNTAIVTGASRGIGAGLVEAFLQRVLTPPDRADLQEKD
jgi:hypothetical protein